MDRFFGEKDPPARTNRRGEVKETALTLRGAAAPEITLNRSIKYPVTLRSIVFFGRSKKYFTIFQAKNLTLCVCRKYLPATRSVKSIILNTAAIAAR